LPGKYFFSSGAVYDGTFTDNQMHGEGTYRWPKDVDEPQLVAPQADAPSQHAPKVSV
jgi:MORN repeat